MLFRSRGGSCHTHHHRCTVLTCSAGGTCSWAPEMQRWGWLPPLLGPCLQIWSHSSALGHPANKGARQAQHEQEPTSTTANREKSQVIASCVHWPSPKGMMMDSSGGLPGNPWCQRLAQSQPCQNPRLASSALPHGSCPYFSRPGRPSGATLPGC